MRADEVILTGKGDIEKGGREIVDFYFISQKRLVDEIRITDFFTLS